MMPNAIQGKYILGAVTKVGDPRRKHEDRVFKGEVVRTGGEPLIIGIVADGVGSADAGERGAQLAIDTVLRRLKDSQGENIPEILERAIEYANRVVFDENQKSNADGLTTIVVAVIYRDRCYVGNVGDSRAYWIQGGKGGNMLQLTRDHSYANIYGGVDSKSEEGGVLVNAIGKKEDVFVDLGFYLKGNNDEEQANRLGVNGLPIKQGDSIMLCSDGLIKESPNGERYATDDEIRISLQTEHEPDTAAIKMVSAALGRRPDDNVSAVTIQYISQETMTDIIANKNRENTSRVIKQIVPIGGVIIALVVVAGLLVLINKFVNPPIQQLQALPTYTPYPTLSSPNNIFVSGQTAGSIGKLTQPQGQSQDLVNGIFVINENSKVEISQNGAIIGLADGSSLYMPAGTVFVFTKLQGGMELTLQNGAIMVKLNGTSPLSIKTVDGFSSQVSGSIMGVNYSQQPAGEFVDCYEGHCTISGGNLVPETLDGERRYLFFTAGSVVVSDQFQRCQYWKTAIGEDVVSSLGINCVVERPTETPRPTPLGGYPTSTRDRGGNGDVGTPSP